MVTCSSAVLSINALPPIVVTVAGIVRSTTAVPLNAFAPISVTLPRSMEVSASQFIKALAPTLPLPRETEVKPVSWKAPSAMLVTLPRSISARALQGCGALSSSAAAIFENACAPMVSTLFKVTEAKLLHPLKVHFSSSVTFGGTTKDSRE